MESRDFVRHKAYWLLLDSCKERSYWIPGSVKYHYNLEITCLNLYLKVSGVNFHSILKATKFKQEERQLSKDTISRVISGLFL